MIDILYLSLKNTKLFTYIEQYNSLSRSRHKYDKHIYLKYFNLKNLTLIDCNLNAFENQFYFGFFLQFT